MSGTDIDEYLKATFNRNIHMKKIVVILIMLLLASGCAYNKLDQNNKERSQQYPTLTSTTNNDGISEEQAKAIATKYMGEKGFNPQDYDDPEILKEDAYPDLYSTYRNITTEFSTPYYWVGFLSKNYELPVIHIFIEKSTGKPLGILTNE